LNNFYLYYKSKIALDEHLADQIIPYLSLAPNPSSFTTIISSHLVTNIQVITQFLNRNITYIGEISKLGLVRVV